MRIGLFVNDIRIEAPRFTTTVLAREAVSRGHEVFYIEVDDFLYRPADELQVRARRAPKDGSAALAAFIEALRSAKAGKVTLPIDELDVLLLRNDPALDAGKRPWAQSVGIIFGQIAAKRGVLVLNDPAGLSGALNKLYFQYFPEEVRPATLITRSPADIKSFIAERKGKVVLKPLQGSGGQNVFLVRRKGDTNTNQMIEAVLRDGYVIAQEYVPAAAKGDIRLFLLNGSPLACDGKYAALRRVNAEGELRSNMHAGGRPEKVEIDEVTLRIAEVVRPRLVEDGMFLVGLDIAGDKLIEINVFSPGGLCSASRLEKAPFAEVVVDSLERKIECRHRYPGQFDNKQLAVL